MSKSADDLFPTPIELKRIEMLKAVDELQDRINLANEELGDCINLNNDELGDQVNIDSITDYHLPDLTCLPNKPIGYHEASINRGTFGEVSKIVEEALELQDADKQGIKVMTLVELSDLYGAIEGYLNKKYGGTVTMNDLADMAKVTKRAFEAGRR